MKCICAENDLSTMFTLLSVFLNCQRDIALGQDRRVVFITVPLHSVHKKSPISIAKICTGNRNGLKGNLSPHLLYMIYVLLFSFC